MAVPRVFRALEPAIQKMLDDPELAASCIQISCKVLTARDAIGDPDRNDFPLQKGKESLMHAMIKGYAGQAYTDLPGSFEGTLKEVFALLPTDNYRRGAIIAALNAVLRMRGAITNTVHCKDKGPGICSTKLVEKIASEYGKPRIAVIGLQPAMVDQLARNYQIRVFDLDPNNIGKEINGVCIENGGECDLDEVDAWCDLILATGSTVVNGSIDSLLQMKKPKLFYGTTIAGPAKIMGLNRFCPVST